MFDPQKSPRSTEQPSPVNSARGTLQATNTVYAVRRRGLAAAWLWIGSASVPLYLRLRTQPDREQETYGHPPQSA